MTPTEEKKAAMTTEQTTEKDIPAHVLMKVINRRRRLRWWERNGAPDRIVEAERELVDKALDDLCAWAEEHAPELFYREPDA
jgi:DNA-directed RNA polymerase beta' subunit